MADERICINCESDIFDGGEFIMVDDKYLCDAHCLGEFLTTHGLAVLHQGKE